MGNGGGLVLIKKLAADKSIKYSEKVQWFLENGYFSPEDIECCLCNGYVHKTTKDRFKCSIGNKVYHIKGKDLSGYDFYTQGKIVKNENGKIYFLITAHR